MKRKITTTKKKISSTTKSTNDIKEKDELRWNETITTRQDIPADDEAVDGERGAVNPILESKEETLNLQELKEAHEELKIKQEQQVWTHDQLLEALYSIHMIFEKATMTMVCIKETGLAIKHDKPLTGDGIYIATRQLEWDSGNRHVVDTLIQYADITDNLITYKANNGVPIYLRICEDDYCISSPDGKPYMSEWFQLPNPFERFQEVYG